MQTVIDIIERDFDKYVADLSDFLRIPSVAEHLLSIGFTEARVIETRRHPVVIAEHLVSTSLPTVLAYGHYDVQPPEPLELWTSPPFDPTVRDNVIYARGAVDDKGQLMMIVKAVEACAKAGAPLPVNVRMVIEGEEEIGSPSLDPFIESHRDWLDVDALLVCDTSMWDRQTAAVTCSLRGICYTEIELRTGTRDLHSGAFGGAALNVFHVLSNVLAKLHDSSGRVSIPGFYDNAVSFDEETLREIRDIPFDEARWREGAGGSIPAVEKGYGISEVTRVRPCVDVHGMYGGFQGDGAKTVIPHVAYAKVSARLVKNQEPEEIFEKITSFVESAVPAEVSVKVRAVGFAHPVVIPTSSPVVAAARLALGEVFDNPPVMLRGSGSIPAVSMFQKHLGIDSALIGFGLAGDNLHAPNESFGLDRFRLGIESVARFLHHYGDSLRG